MQQARVRSSRLALLVGAALAAPLVLASRPDAGAEPGRRAVELTFLRSSPGQREALRRYLVANWFAMDAVAVREGLMDRYQILEAQEDEGAWDLVVAVTYRDAQGYEGIAPAFERIRSAHREVRPDGKALRELGRIVESRKLLEEPR